MWYFEFEMVFAWKFMKDKSSSTFAILLTTIHMRCEGDLDAAFLCHCV